MNDRSDGDGGSRRRKRNSSRPPGTRVTISMVAQSAQVSRATVSRVMNGHDSVDPELAERVRRVALSLGYEPDPIAQSLARGRTGLVAIVVPDLANPMFQAVLHGLSEGASKDNYRVLVADSGETQEEESILAREARRRCDAVVLCAPRMSAEELVGLAPELSPVVLVNRRVEGLGIPTVSIDHEGGMRAVAQHLAALGHRQVAYLSGPQSSAANHERLAGLRETAQRRFSMVEIDAGSMFADGFDAVDQALAAEVTAIVGYNDLVAFGAVARLHELGVSVPGDVSVTGFDDIPFSRYANPPLTTVAVPQQDLGQEAWQRLAAVLAGEQPSADVIFSSRLVVRASTGPAPARVR